MKVLYVSGNFENVQPKLLEALNKAKGVQATLVNYDLRKTNRKADLPEYAEYYSLNNHIHGPVLYLARLYCMAKKIGNNMAIHDIDVMHANMAFRDGIICYLLGKWYQIPYVVTVRNTDINNRILWKIPWVKRFFYKVLKNAKYIICLSDSYKYKLLEMLPTWVRTDTQSKIRIIGNGIDSFYLENKYLRTCERERDVWNLLFVGKVEKLKNLETVIDAIDLLLKDKKVFKLDVVGDIVDEEYRQLISNKSFVTYHPRCKKEELISFYRVNDILIVPSHTESFGLVYAEALSQSMPVIYTRGQGFDSNGRDGIIGFAVSDTDPNEIAEKILCICREYEKYSNNCYKAIDNFDWNVIADKIVCLYLDDNRA